MHIREYLKIWETSNTFQIKHIRWRYGRVNLFSLSFYGFLETVTEWSRELREFFSSILEFEGDFLILFRLHWRLPTRQNSVARLRGAQKTIAIEIIVNGIWAFNKGRKKAETLIISKLNFTYRYPLFGLQRGATKKYERDTKSNSIIQSIYWPDKGHYLYFCT